MRGDEEKCRAAGCSGFLTKPIDMDLLVRTVAEAMGGGHRTDGAEVSPTAVDARRGTRRPGSLTPISSSLPTDDPEFCEIVVEFVDRLHEQLGAMQEAWERKDLDDWRQLAHWLKGSGGTAGFDALTDPARQLGTARPRNRSSTRSASHPGPADRISLQSPRRPD